MCGVQGAPVSVECVNQVAIPDPGARPLAAMLPRPRFYDRNRNTVYLDSYSARILGRMSGAQLP